ncbi:LysR family transcriptional regulator [Vibrio sp. CAIM 722]|uniref:LysR family transcriptional regulator n=1 Tax=Vibrio eleionomae TaxID=2653505 RepID=A0A7X4LHV3_9VIBR|nr:LysR family transcriptional regulator [Vibrio eleionomae]
MQDFASIRAFYALCEKKSLTAAAKYLHQPKFTVSRRLTTLENEVGQSLMIRRGNRLAITQAGEVFHSYCKKILDLTEESIDAMQKVSNEISGELTIIVHTNLVRGWFNKLINNYLDDNPNLNINIISQYQAAYQDVDPDLILWLGELSDISWRQETIGYWCYSVFASQAYMEKNNKLNHPNDIREHRWLHYAAAELENIELSNSDGETFQVEHLPSRFHSDNISLQLDGITAGRGIGLLPVSIYHKFNEMHHGKLVPCLPDWHSDPRPIICYTPRDKHQVKVQTLVNRMQETRPKHWHQRLS